MSRQRISHSLIVLGALAALYCGARPDKPEEPPADGRGDSQVKRVRIARVETTPWGRDLRFSGVSRAVRRGRLAFTRGGRLAARPVEAGDRVREGQELARLDDRELGNGVDFAAAALAELTERLAQARRERERATRLLAVKAATAEEVERTSSSVETLEASMASSRSSLAEARRRLRESRLLAPFSGVVTEVLLEPGEYALSGGAVVVLTGDGELEVEVEVPETLIPRLEQGLEVEVSVPALGARGPGLVKSLGLTALGPGRLFPMVVSVEAEGAMAGMTTEVFLRLRSDDAMVLPVEAVIDPGGRQPAVFRVSAGEVERVPVSVGGLLGEKVVIEGALASGDAIVVGGQLGLLDGERVEVVP